jgi:hypothetical protein
MNSMSFQKTVINSGLVDEVSFSDVPCWLCGMLMDDAMSCDTPWMGSLFAVAATRYGDWVKAYASAWIGDDEVLVAATTDMEAANEFAKDYDCRIEVCHRAFDNRPLACISEPAGVMGA